MARYVLQQFCEPKHKEGDDLFSSRELEILEAIAQGQIQKEIAQDLNLSPKTIDFHLGQIYKKLDVHNAPAAISQAYKRGSLY